MCGIVGYIQTGRQPVEVDRKYQNALAELLFLDTLRGEDSTGVAVIPQDKTVKPFVVKSAVPGFVFISLDEYKRVTHAQKNPGVYIGHNRAATKGEINDENAHPFVKDHIILVHNGSIHNHYSLGSGSTSQVDSCHIAWAIAKDGASKVLSNIDGPAVLVWHDSIENSVNVARTKDREIRWIFDKYGTCWFASEKEMLWCALHRNGIEPKGGFITLEEYTHVKWQLTGSDKDLGTYTKTKFEEFVPAWKRGYNQGQQDWGRNYTNGGAGSHMGKEQSSTGAAQKGSASGNTSLTCTATTINDPDLKRHEKISKRKVKYVDQKLEKYELSVGDEIFVTRHSWYPSKDNPEVGDIICTWADKNLKVILPDVHKNLWERKGSNQYAVIVYNVVQEIIPKAGKHQPVLYAKPKNYQIKDLVQGPGGTLITKDEFNILAKEGCAWCPEPTVIVANHDITEWVNGRPLCLNCSHNFSNVSEKFRK